MRSSTDTWSVHTRLGEHVARYLDKTWDWDAFPANRGYAELARAQMRYIGAGGSPKVDDESTLPARHFTWTLVYLQPNRYAAMHVHEIEELFLVREGVLTVTWNFDGEIGDVRLGPGDAILNPPGRPHGFRNDGPDDVVFQVMVGSPRPLLPKYISHPSDGENMPLGTTPAPPDAYARHRSEFESHIVRASEVVPAWIELEGGARFARYAYVVPKSQGGRVEPHHYAVEIHYLPPDTQLPLRRQSCEEALMVVEGWLNVAWEDDSGERACARLGRRDLVLMPPGQQYQLSNTDPAPVRFVLGIGDPACPEPVWQLAGGATS